jgi:predicted HAD superfamily Cof-like phosphohydrolase
MNISHLWSPGSLFRRVFDFMLTYRQSGPEAQAPRVPSDHVVRQRLRWHLEETFELLRACLANEGDQVARSLASSVDGIASYHPPLDLFRVKLIELIRDAKIEVNLVEYADANADIRFISYGNDIAAGIYSPAVDQEVARSNDTKDLPLEQEGKVRKGPNYSPPDIEGVLRKQGWKGAA